MPKQTDPSSGSDGRALLVINQVAGPLMIELLSELASRGWRCRLLTGELQHGAELPAGVELIRATRLNKSAAIARLWTWGAFTARAFWTLLAGSDTHALVVTNPPFTMLMMPLFRRLRAIRYVVLVYDVYPDVAEKLGMLKPGGVVARVWRRLSGLSTRRADGVVTLGEYMARRLLSHTVGRHAPEIRVIPPWVDTDHIRPISAEGNSFRTRHGLQGKFVVLHSGAFGATHDVESILDAAERLKDTPHVIFVLIGAGTRMSAIATAVDARKLPNLIQLPFQPLDVFPEALAAGDCMVVSADAGSAGLMMPSRSVYGLAAGAALLALTPPDTELARLVEQWQCGRVLSPGGGEGLAATIRELAGDAGRLAALRRNARDAAVGEYSRATQVQVFATFLEQRLGGKEIRR